MSERPDNAPRIDPDPGKGRLEHPRNVDRIVHGLYALCALSVLLEFVVHRHETLSFAGWFGFYAWFGFVACVGLVLAARVLRRVLMRSEDYYDDGDAS
ncbi:hypothetical protein PC39_06174 [Salinisphaera sp. PC39]|uniref:hypothetical protein n=1 Tax=Salinisphaera sp. PC39 TaxID=1304156 RepID=UPI00333F7145